MPVTSPVLDDRRFQDIVDEAKRLIPHYCPEWTDHNVSDPGVALLELMAWMTEMLLYRVNQVPEKNYLKFLEMIGIKLQPPAAARTAVTFYLSAPQPTEITIPRETETATIRTETSPAVIFTTEADLSIRPPAILGCYTHAAAAGKDDWASHDLHRLATSEDGITIFPNPPRPDDAFYLALRDDHSHHVLALEVGCKRAGGAGVDPKKPPLQWQVWQGGVTRWAPCAVERDSTRGFNADGEILLHLPKMAAAEFAGRHAYWLRCQLTETQAEIPYYETPPVVQRYLRLESRGGTVEARHAITIREEVLGASDGRPGQTFQLLHSPVLARDPGTDHLVVESANGHSEAWEEVPDFGESTERDHHYTLDDLTGAITLGPALLQPDGRVYRFGAIPPRGSTLRFTRYQSGGGVQGNVPTGAIGALKSSIPYVARVTNRERCIGGRDAQSVEDAKLRAALHLRSRTRAVTAEDFEFHACQVPGIARAECLAPGPQPGEASAIQPGQVFVIVLPEVDAKERPSPDDLTLSTSLRESALKYLINRSVLGAAVEVRMAEICWVSVHAALRFADSIERAAVEEAISRAEKDLYRYLNPYVGGPQGKGWPFGRSLHLSEIYGLLQKISNVEFVENVNVYVSRSGSAPPSEPAPPRLLIPKHAVICSGTHRIDHPRREEFRSARAD
jgi:predicted phage baseplate assembly protein